MIHKQASAKDTLINAMYEIEAILNLLDEKGIISKNDVLNEMRKLKMNEHEDERKEG